MRMVNGVILLAFLAMFLIPTSSSITQIPGSPLSISFVSQTHSAIGGGCYTAQVTLLFSYNSTGTYQITLRNIWLYFIGTGLIVSNSTYYIHPSNTLAMLVLFPNVPVTFQLGFTSLCVPAAVTNVQAFIFYFDGRAQFNIQVF